jgi:hypothetical protein
MTGKTHAPDGPVFADITDEVDAMLAEPQTAESIESQRPAREAMNRAFAMNLATIRKATVAVRSCCTDRRIALTIDDAIV